jgi:hypothetical protein
MRQALPDWEVPLDQFQPLRSPEEFLGLLERTGLALTAQRLRDAIDLL